MESCPAQVTFAKAWISERDVPAGESSCDRNAELDYHLSFDIQSNQVGVFRKVKFDYIVELTLLGRPADRVQKNQEVKQLRNVEVVIAGGLDRKGVIVSRFAGCKYGWKVPSGPAQPSGQVKVRNVSISGIECRPL